MHKPKNNFYNRKKLAKFLIIIKIINYKKQIIPQKKTPFHPKNNLNKNK